MFGFKVRSHERVNSDLNIRAATGADADILTSLAFRSKASWGYSLEFMAACKDELTYTSAMIEAPDYQFYVFEINGRLAGFYALELYGNETAELDALFVLPDKIGTGIGKAMIRHCRSIAARLGIREIVIQGDPNAEAFYLSVGAQACGYRESQSIPGRQLPVFTIKL